MRLVFANESRAGMRLDEGLLKSMTGADTMTARELYQAEFDFVPTHKIWLRTNSAPLFDGGDSGMQRRVRLVPFDHVVPVKDPKLPEKLRGEAAGILNWALAGLADYQRNGLVEPAVVTESTKGYVEGLDHIRQFLDAKCELGAAFDQPSGELHATYAWWCGTEQLRPLGVKRFGAELASRGFKSRILSGRNIWAGLRLTEGQAKPAW
jgi:putative DNA primase/helicase